MCYKTWILYRATSLYFYSNNQNILHRLKDYMMRQIFQILRSTNAVVWILISRWIKFHRLFKSSRRQNIFHVLLMIKRVSKLVTFQWKNHLSSSFTNEYVDVAIYQMGKVNYFEEWKFGRLPVEMNNLQDLKNLWNDLRSICKQFRMIYIISIQLVIL